MKKYNYPGRVRDMLDVLQLHLGNDIKCAFARENMPVGFSTSRLQTRDLKSEYITKR